MFLTHLHARPLARPAGDDQVVRAARPRRPLTVYGPPGITALIERRCGPSSAARGTGCTSSSSSSARRSSATATRSPRSRSATASSALRLRARRGRAPGALRRRGARAAGVTPGPDFGRLQRGETVNGVAPEQVIGPDRARAARSCYSGDTAPCDAVRGRRPPAPTCSSTRRRSPRRSATARARPGTRPPGRRRSSRREPEVRLLALTHLSTRYGGARDPGRGARGVPEHRRPARLRRRSRSRSRRKGEPRAACESPRALARRAWCYRRPSDALKLAASL